MSHSMIETLRKYEEKRAAYQESSPTQDFINRNKSLIRDWGRVKDLRKSQMQENSGIKQ